MYIRNPDVDVFAGLENLAQGKRYRAGFQTSHRHLIKQGLKLEIVVFVQQHDLHIGALGKALCDFQAGESGSYDDNTLFIGIGNIG